jgi:hypothetical protein
MANWQFGVLVVLLVWIIWRTRVVAQTTPWLRDALLRRIFGKLNAILSAATQVPTDLFDPALEDESWWLDEMNWNGGKPWWHRRRCGPWCHSDWQTPGISRAQEIEYERTHSHEESEEQKRETFERTKRLAGQMLVINAKEGVPINTK